jgi:carbonic anhydrase/acetyltransferase-like protein (isoleucine patch superfamily)
MRIPYRDYIPDLAPPANLAPMAAVAGRTVAGPHLELRPYATLRADGEWVRVGANGFFAERATVHIADAVLGTTIGDDVTVGRYGIVHACTVADGVVVADGATVMDGASVGAYALVAPGALVSPRKQLAGGWIYEGNPATPTREIDRDELAAIAHAIRTGMRTTLGTSDDLPPLDMAPFVPHGPFEGVLHEVHGRAPRVGRAFVAPTSVLVGDVRIADDAGVYFACALAAGDARIVVGERTNVQDNTLIVTDAARGDVTIGRDVTIGHNVRMGSGTFHDRALVGMASRVGDGVVVEPDGCIAAGAHVEPGTVVKAGWIWAGRPARPFRALKPHERDWFAQGVAVYVEYGRAYLGAFR